MNNCIFCNSKNIRKFGRLKVRFTDIPLDKNPQIISINRQRYQCKDCEKTFFEALLGFDNKRQCTNRLKDWLIQESFNQSFADLSIQTGLNESTIRRIFEEYARSKGVDLPARKAVKFLKNINKQL